METEGCKQPVDKLVARKRSSGDIPDANPPRAAKKPRKKKTYVPALRSGPYAILLALSTLPGDSSNGLTKIQTIEIAQKHCDSSFSVPSDPTKFYTAWNSMKALQTKDLVYDFGRPTKKYALTEEGWEVAKNIRDFSGLDNAKILETEDPSISSNTSASPALGTVNNTSTQTSLLQAPPMAQPSQTKRQAMTYYDALDLEDDGVGDLTAHGVHGTVLRQKATSNSFHSCQLPEKPSQPSKPATLPWSKIEPDFVEIISSPPPSPPARTNAQKIQVGTVPTQLPDSNLSKNEVIGLPQTRYNVLENRATSPNVNPTNPSDPSDASVDLPTFQPIHIPSGSFTVELVLDNREIRSKTDRDYIQSSLIDLGIRPITRALELGDCLWVARVHDPTILSGFSEEGSEVILDWILERKRLDDLIGSIKDGRFMEQKFRLRRSGVKNVIYVIEDIALSTDVATKYHEHMVSAVASTQVVDGFFVKRTQKLDETIRYLARLTALLKSIYEPHPLRVIPSHILDRQTYLPLKASLKDPHYITYASFASLASKTDTLTLRDIFLKMLMCSRGITAEKAIEIQKRWSTPRAFIEVLRACDGHTQVARPRGRGGGTGNGGNTLDNKAAVIEERRELVWSVAGNLVGRRKIGKAISAKVGEVWGEP